MAVRASLLPLVALLTVTSAASAQSASSVDVSGGYQLLYAASDANEMLGKGWYADLSAALARGLRVVAQVGGNYRSEAESVVIDGVRAQVEGSLKLHEFMGGARFQPGGTPAVTPFAQLLVGGMTGSFKVAGSLSRGGTEVFAADISETYTEFAMQAGGGANVRLTDRFGVRLGADYVRLFSDDGGGNMFRFALGAVVGL